MNNVTVIGKLIEDPELRFAANGKAFLRTTVVWDTKKGDEKTSHFLRATMFGDTAEHFAESAQKGDSVILVGRLEQNRWETKDGDKRSEIAMIVDDAGMSVRWTTVVPDRIAREGGNRPRPDTAPF